MADIKDSLQQLLDVNGMLGCCVVDTTSGMVLGSEGGGVDLELAAAGNTELVRAKRMTMQSLDLQDAIEDILITLGKQYHLIRPLGTDDSLFLYAVLDKGRSNLAMARHKLSAVERTLEVS